MQIINCALIANRGEIAVRCIRACHKLQVQTVALYTKADAGSLHIRLADRAVLLDGEGSEAYTDIDTMLRISQDCKVNAVIPGYGFLSENSEFARRVEDLGIAFVGPAADTIAGMGLKHKARELAITAGVPVVPGSDLINNPDEALAAARDVGFPVMIKASGGGGGIGMHICSSADEVAEAFNSVQGRSTEIFKDSGVFLERYIPKSHHIEVQVFGNGSEVIHFGERECSIQRRQQKVIEECPSPFLADKPEQRSRLISCAVSLAQSIGYRSAGTVEFLVDDETGEFFFLEMNTRLQVEHGITELCYNVDLVELMLQQADYQLQKLGGIPSDQLRNLQRSGPSGAAIEARICSEDPASSFLPSSGHIQEVVWPMAGDLRVDTWIQTGSSVSPYFDSLLAKLMVHSSSREESVRLLKSAISQSKIAGVSTNLLFLEAVASCPDFTRGITLTTFLEKQFEYRPSGLRVEEAGLHTTVQQFRPRSQKGYGIARSGPMDDVSATVANLLVGNPRDMECLEVTAEGPVLRCYSPTVMAVCGAPFAVDIDGKPMDMWTRFILRPNQVLKVGPLTGSGYRCFIAVKGGLPRLPEWLGSKSTTPSLGLGGLQGRALRAGDLLETDILAVDDSLSREYSLPRDAIPSTLIEAIYVMHGPHDSDDFITQSGRETLYGAHWQVDHNCSRTGIRLTGPQIQWARADGGRAGGAHPSNVVDYPYPSPGGVNWTGDTPVIFPNDAPGLGGFLCSSTVVSEELWKLGQLKPRDSFRLCPISLEAARKLDSRKQEYFRHIENLCTQGNSTPPPEFPWQPLLADDVGNPQGAILDVIETPEKKFLLTLRQGGDSFIIVDLGSQEASLETSVAANRLAKVINAIGHADIFCHTNISSIMLEYDPRKRSQEDMRTLIRVSSAKTQIFAKKLPCRRLVLPIVFDHPEIQEAEDRYTALQRSKAAYLPDNVAYVQENNGLPARDAVFDILRRTRFITVAVGFMTGLPLMLPLDPAARLTAQKHNPTRIYTPSGAVGLGGGLFCVYPTAQPGGYMIVARSIPVWDQFCFRNGFSAGRPWLCEPFDLIEFREVSHSEYDQIQTAFEAGTYQVEIEDAEFDVEKELANERAALTSESVLQFRRDQDHAAENMRLREESLYAEWQAEQLGAVEDVAEQEELPGDVVTAPYDGKVWKVRVKAGDRITAAQELIVIEAMKMEIKIKASVSQGGLQVDRMLVEEGAFVRTGKALLNLV